MLVRAESRKRHQLNFSCSISQRTHTHRATPRGKSAKITNMSRICKLRSGSLQSPGRCLPKCWRELIFIFWAEAQEGSPFRKRFFASVRAQTLRTLSFPSLQFDRQCRKKAP